ncbi:MAG: hypothetical protein COY66_01690 [Candidatus Kerfeldbacteria bacterium CG_4_10_14_0_8_um_filter_42_10]|uniref:Type II secretion system protein n=1 Tax=Candidatus Kerfeldbacteria bacterium CG_4_10_14_0_8_um_filter_42_10 TaxID=2014248 RepID=A0A2M7RJU1_9BACT|nr:MAG: hypothetical protein COY66_01690 [Candidatus Kerfeldbacteria bacterium CG_4_10_14_0_8_um_filter_42_10]
MLIPKGKLVINSKAQSMIELVVAVSVILVGVVSTLVLTMATIRGGKASKQQVIAASLGREGAEVARMTRDNNWLSIEASKTRPSSWDDNLGLSDDHTAIAIFNATNITWTLDYENGTDFSTCLQDEKCRIFFKDGLYAQFADPANRPLGWEPTEYYRLISTLEICADYQSIPSDEFCPPANPKIGINVKSETRWFEKNNWRTLIFEDHLYNWK